MTKQGIRVKYTLAAKDNLIEEGLLLKQLLFNNIQNSNLEIELNVQLKTLSFTMVPEAGLIIKIEKFWKTGVPLNKKLMLGPPGTKFQFRFNPDSTTYMGELYEGQYELEASKLDNLKLVSSSRDILNSNINSNEERGKPPINVESSISNRGEVKSPKMMSSTQRHSVLELDLKAHPIGKSLGDNIHTLRLIDNVVCEIEEMKTEEKEELEQLESKENESVFKQNDDKEEMEDDNGFELRSIKTRKQFYDIINQRDVPKVIKNLKWGGNILAICLMAIAFISHFISVMEFQEITDTMTLKVLQDRKMSELIYIAQNVQYLVLLNKGLFGTSKSALEKQYKNDILLSLAAIEDIQNTLQLSSGQLSEAQISLLNSNAIRMYFDSNTSQFFDLNQASQQLISKSFKVVNLNLTDFSFNEPNIFFVIFNIFNDFYLNLQTFSDYFTMNLFYVIDQKKNIFLALLIIAVLLDFISIVILIPLTSKVSESKDKVLSLFLDIPPKVLKKLCVKCENFLTNLQVGDEDDVASERSETVNTDEFEEDESEIDPAKLKKKKKRKKSKKSSRAQRKFITILVCAVLVFEIYFGMNYFLSETLMQGLLPLVQEANDTSQAESTFAFYHAILRFFTIYF